MLGSEFQREEFLVVLGLEFQRGVSDGIESLMNGEREFEIK